jgi:hypothetical protein
MQSPPRALGPWSLLMHVLHESVTIVRVGLVGCWFLLNNATSC